MGSMAAYGKRCKSRSSPLTKLLRSRSLRPPTSVLPPPRLSCARCQSGRDDQISPPASSDHHPRDAMRDDRQIARLTIITPHYSIVRIIMIVAELPWGEP